VSLTGRVVNGTPAPSPTCIARSAPPWPAWQVKQALVSENTFPAGLRHAGGRMPVSPRFMYAVAATKKADGGWIPGTTGIKAKRP
jgi:hypothetical protein